MPVQISTSRPASQRISIFICGPSWEIWRYQSISN